MTKFYLFKIDELFNKKIITEFYPEIRDEVTTYIDSNGSPKSFSSVCPHMAGELYIGGTNTIKCRWHGLNFTMDGDVINCKYKLKLTIYETIIDNNNVYINYET